MAARARVRRGVVFERVTLVGKARANLPRCTLPPQAHVLVARPTRRPSRLRTEDLTEKKSSVYFNVHCI